MLNAFSILIHLNSLPWSRDRKFNNHTSKTSYFSITYKNRATKEASWQKFVLYSLGFSWIQESMEGFFMWLAGLWLCLHTGSILGTIIIVKMVWLGDSSLEVLSNLLSKYCTATVVNLSLKNPNPMGLKWAVEYSIILEYSIATKAKSSMAHKHHLLDK